MAENISEIFLRTIVSILMITHGIARMAYGIVDDFGVYLSETGFPFGGLLAWGITFGEIIFGISIIAGFYIRYAAAFFIITLTAGLILVHLPEGWFVVGIGRNGMEYSVLLITVFIYLIWNDFIKSKDRSQNTQIR